MKLQAFHKIPAPDDKARCQLLIDTHRVIYYQPKINGVSCHISFTRDPDLFVLQTKNEKVWKQGFFPPEVYEELKKYRANSLYDLILHCEISSVDDSMPLATIAGHVNVNSAKCGLESEQIRFHVYDLSRTGSAEPFNFRNRRMFQLRERELRSSEMFRFKFLAASAFYTAEEIDRAYHTVVDHGGEGVVYRCDPNYYFDGNTETPHAWKRPRYYTAEGTIIAVVEGEGKRKGMLGSFVIRLDDGTTVLSVGGGEGVDDALLTRYWNDRNDLIRSRLTYRYSELSRFNTPLRPQIVAVRNYE